MKYVSTAHWFHAIMTFVTGGFWIVIWLACWASNNQENKKIERAEALEQRQNAKFVNQYKGWLNK